MIANPLHAVGKVWHLDFRHGFKVPALEDLHDPVEVTDFISFSLKLQVFIGLHDSLLV